MKKSAKRLAPGASIPQPMLIKIPVAWLQARCAGFVWKPHQNKAQVPYHLAVANTQAGKISRPLWESYLLGRNFYREYSGLIEDLAVALSRKRLSRSAFIVLSIRAEFL